MSSIRKGTKGVVSTNMQTPRGMIYKGTKIVVEEYVSDDQIRIHDQAGRVLWVKSSNILMY
jgi:hypothetical protein